MNNQLKTTPCLGDIVRQEECDVIVSSSNMDRNESLGVCGAISIGDDSDTLAAITGAIAEARFMIPDELCKEALRRMPDDLRTVIFQMYRDAFKHSDGYRMPVSCLRF